MKPMSAPVNGAPQRQRGVAAVELAIIMCLTAFLLPAIFLFGRVFLQYNVLKQATYDAANSIASIPLGELRDSSKVDLAGARAETIVRTAVTEAGIALSQLGHIRWSCDGGMDCGPNRPLSITVTARLTINGFDFNAATLQWLNGSYEWELPASSTVSYAN